MTGATGQDGYFLVHRLLDDGWQVWAPVRDVGAASELFRYHPALHAVRRDLLDPGPLCALIGDVRPEELYNLAGESSVSASFADPRRTWNSNAQVVVDLLDAIRADSPQTRVYQASSGEMFGSTPAGAVLHDETSPLNPQSPYAAAKAAAHFLCRSYRESYDIRIACGILFNHESSRRGPQFLTRKIVDHLVHLRETGRRDVLHVGNLRAQRDWGYAPDYVEGMMMIVRQARLRDVEDRASNYRDYVLGTGVLHHVWELVDRAYALAGYELVWHLAGADPLDWNAAFADNGEPAVVADPAFVRPADPLAIAADPARIQDELGWQPRPGVDRFLDEMLAVALGGSSQAEPARPGASRLEETHPYNPGR